jgi:hypothetical protein
VLTVGAGDRPLGQSLAYVREDVGQPGGLVVAFGPESRGPQRRIDRVRGRFHAVFPVGEQVHVLRRAGGDPVGEQGVSAAEREPVPGSGGQRD